MNYKSTPNAASERLAPKLAFLCFAVLGAAYVVNAMDRQVFAMVLPFVMKDYGFPLPTGGLLVSIFTLGIGLAGIPTGYLLERLSRKAVMMIAITIYSVFTILTAYASGFADMFIYRTATGIGEGMQIAALYTAVGAYFPRQRALIFAVLSAMFGAGNFISPLVAGNLLESNHWKLPLIVFGLLGFVFVVLIGFVSKNFTEHRETANDESIGGGSKDSLWNRNLVLAVVAAVTFGLSQFALLSIYPTFLAKAFHLPPSSIGLIMSMFGLGIMCAVPIGYLGDRLPQKWIVAGALFGGAVLGYLVFNFAATATQHATLSFLIGVLGGTFIANTSSLMQRCVPAMHIGKASGIYVTAVYLPASFSGYFFGLLIAAFDWGNAALIQLAAVPALGAVALLFLEGRRRASRPAAVQQDASVRTA